MTDVRKTHGAFSWMELQGEDAASTQDFYAELFGWKPVPMPMQDGGTYPGFALGEEPIGGFAGKPDLGRHWLPYITVDDVDATVGAAARSGGRVVAEPFDAPGVGRIAVIEDPMGAPAAVITYPEA